MQNSTQANERASQPTAPVKGRTSRGLKTVTVAGLMVGWLPFAVGEALYGNLDAMDDLSAIAANSTRFGFAATLEFITALAMIPAIIGMMYLLARRRPVLGAVGGVISLAGVVALGAFVELHLLALEMSAPGLDQAAMTEFIATRLDGFGAFAVPLLLVLVMPLGLLLLAIGLKRAKLVTLWAPILVGVHILIHFGVETELGEAGSHFVLAAALALIGWRVHRMPTSEWNGSTAT